MITKSKQAWFDTAWERAKIKVRSETDINGHINCRYSAPGPDVPGCFIGVSMSPDEAAEMDRVGSTAHALVFDRRIGVAELPAYDAAEFLQALQTIHDRCEPETWFGRLRKFAKTYGLQTPDNGEETSQPENAE